ncbi:nickel-responsive transcriptional regulator NikR [Paraburkholderia tagetis]|uniref:Putative nickel-responsive regulator n=1 Tax=Paraburkholderia tagetis TaxID=2913261 RepID=A0A9X1RUC4_9BURK|nr:nickel-responsive transcriptional regulator NikR [Paraburkholderia tagetis]MCG5074838.1 nickel-responsive transcriptional regulator NikR [Paraburkholderia tagetis]
MQRITITIDDFLLATLDETMRQHGYNSRSEALRDILRAHRSEELLDDVHAQCVGTLTIVFEHGVRELAQRLADAYHAQHALIVSSSRIYLDHDNCLETIVLRGEVGTIQQFAWSLASQRGVRNSNLHLMPLMEESAPPHEHLHV